MRTPSNADFHWGNFLLVTDEDAVDDADRWVAAFGVAFPEATWVAVGLPRMPGARDAWAAHDVDLELEDVLSTRTLPRPTPLPEGYTVRRLTGAGLGAGPRPLGGGERAHPRGGPDVVPALRAGAAAGPTGPLRP